MEFQVIPKNQQFISPLTRLKIFANGETLAHKARMDPNGYTEMRDDHWNGISIQPVSPTGANCLNACGRSNPAGKRDFSDYLTRGYGHIDKGWRQRSF